MVTLAPGSHKGSWKCNLIMCLAERGAGSIWQIALVIPQGLRGQRTFQREWQGRGWAGVWQKEAGYSSVPGLSSSFVASRSSPKERTSLESCVSDLSYSPYLPLTLYSSFTLSFDLEEDYHPFHAPKHGQTFGIPEDSL